MSLVATENWSPVTPMKGGMIAEAVITKGQAVIFGTAENGILPAPAGSDLVIGVAMENFSAIGAKGTIALFYWTVMMKVGTAGVTRGKPVEVVSDGIADAPANGGGTTAHSIVGIAFNTGILNDQVGVMLTRMSRSSAT
jgi:hypothetical protein